MSAFKHKEEEEQEKSNNLVKVPPATLASIESLTFPLVQEVVILADYRCKLCKDKVADIVSKLKGDMESMEMMITEKKVIITFAGRYSKAIKTHGKKLQVFGIYKNIVNKVSSVLRYSYAS
ncbi:hypothetical protein M8C21_001509 [Ambrosia artemisiifolia]|uniref:HMA domain-containing protein n=1 Tax=Ambrosia artemisiifolia TaxID=4212 RepID=A0AAD5BS79_AMBAR|nr:hypothetical protein M8C21_001509 [Ambrosia artemisiifolia]